MRRFLTFLLPVYCLLLAVSCGEDRTHEYEEKTRHNHWMYEVMREQYLWSDMLEGFEPKWKDFFAVPESFLYTLAAKSGHSDKWSYVEVDTLVADCHERGYFNHIDSYGMDFLMMTDPTGQTTRSVLRVLTVYPDGPADRAGLVRGDFICAFDGYKISSINVSRLKRGASCTLEVRHLMQEELEGELVWKDTVTVLMEASRYVEDVALPMSGVAMVENRKVGYVMCTRLLECPTEKGVGKGGTTVYRDQLDAVMVAMKQAGIEELVLDLRLCNDGTLSMAQRLASYVVAPGHKGETCFRTIWNQRYADNNVALSYDASVEGLNLSRVYVITSAYTQGAAEWLIHALRYTMGEDAVVTVGKPTAGQDVMTQEVGHEYLVRLCPVVAYVADGGGNYGYGSIEPTLTVDELDYLQLGDYGSLSEILFYTAVADMFGLGQNGDNSDNSSEEEEGEGEKGRRMD